MINDNDNRNDNRNDNCNDSETGNDNINDENKLDNQQPQQHTQRGMKRIAKRASVSPGQAPPTQAAAETGRDYRRPQRNDHSLSFISSPMRLRTSNSNLVLLEKMGGLQPNRPAKPRRPLVDTLRGACASTRCVRRWADLTPMLHTGAAWRMFGYI